MEDVSGHAQLPAVTHFCWFAGVRARQERVTFVACEDEGLLDSDVRPLLGKRVRLQASAQGVLLSADDSSPAAAAGSSTGSGTTGEAAAPKASSGATKKVCLMELDDAVDFLCMTVAMQKSLFLQSEPPM